MVTYAENLEDVERVAKVRKIQDEEFCRDIDAVLTQQAHGPIIEFAYEQIKQSDLWYSLPSNAAVDAKSEELASLIEDVIANWFQIQSAVAATEHIAFPVEHERLRSLREANESEAE